MLLLCKRCLPVASRLRVRAFFVGGTQSSTVAAGANGILPSTLRTFIGVATLLTGSLAASLKKSYMKASPISSLADALQGVATGLPSGTVPVAPAPTRLSVASAGRAAINETLSVSAVWQASISSAGDGVTRVGGLGPVAYTADRYFRLLCGGAPPRDSDG